MWEGMTPQTKRRQETRMSVPGPVRMQTVRGGTIDFQHVSESIGIIWWCRA